jgi:hypothetical protein
MSTNRSHVEIETRRFSSAPMDLSSEFESGPTEKRVGRRQQAEIRLLQYRVLIRILLRTDPVAKDVPVAGIAVVAIGTVHADRNDCCCRRTAATEAIPVKSATAMEAATSASASMGFIGHQACGEQNNYCKRSENIAEHYSKLPSNSPRVGNCGARFAGRLT